MREFEAISNESQVGPKVASVSERSELDEVLRDGARRMLLQAVETEAEPPATATTSTRCAAFA